MDSPLDFPFEEEYDRLNPTREKAGLADGEPLVRVRLPYGGEGWLARRYDHVRAVLADPRFSRAGTIGKDIPRLVPDIDDDDYPNPLSMDPPDHTRLRRVGARAFTARRVALLEPRIQEIIDDLLANMIDAGPPADLMAHFSWPLPRTVMCEILGVPLEDQPKFRGWADATMSVTEFSSNEITSAYENLRSYIGGLVELRRSEPADDFLSVLVKAKDEEDRLSEKEIIGFGLALLVAGYETTAFQFGSFFYTLLTHPDQLAALRADPGLVDTAVDELMRYIPAFDMAVIPQPRMATVDIEVGGVTVRAGECVFADMALANRDPRVFQNPDDLDLTRRTNPHIGFGHGMHHCIGAQLARLELRLGLATVLRRFPHLELAVAESDLTWKRGSVMHGPRELPLTWPDPK